MSEGHEMSLLWNEIPVNHPLVDETINRHIIILAITSNVVSNPSTLWSLIDVLILCKILNLLNCNRFIDIKTTEGISLRKLISCQDFT